MVPFCLDEWSNPESNIHSMLLDHLNKLDQIIVSLKVPLQKYQNQINSPQTNSHSPCNFKKLDTLPGLAQAHECSKTHKFESHSDLPVQPSSEYQATSERQRDKNHMNTNIPLKQKEQTETTQKRVIFLTVQYMCEAQLKTRQRKQNVHR